MESNVTERQQAHALLDLLPDEKLHAVRSLLEVMVEPLSRSLSLPRKRRPRWIAPELLSRAARAFPTKKFCASSA